MATPVVMPRLGDFMTEGVVNKWTKSPGDNVQQGEVIAQIESEKLNYDLEATTAGVFHPTVDEGATVGVDDVMAYLLEEGESAPEPEKPKAASPAPARAATPARSAASRGSGDVVPSTPGARRLAASLGVNLAEVTPSGPRGRIVEADVRSHSEQSKAASPTEPDAPSLPPGMPEPTEETSLTGMRRSIAQHMKRSLADTAQLSYFLEIDVTDAQQMRRDASRDMDGSIGMADVLIKACAEAIGRIPQMNSMLVGDKILGFSEINIGFAVALAVGLIVPVIRNTESKSLSQIATEADDLAKKARANELQSQDLSGGTFTISVLGSVDGFTPILNSGQTGILGVGRSVQKPVVRNGEVVIREMMTISLTADHQVVDGAIAASFMRRLQRLVESPSGLFG